MVLVLLVLLVVMMLILPGRLLMSMNWRDISGRVSEGCSVISSPSLLPVADEILQVLNGTHGVLVRLSARC